MAGASRQRVASLAPGHLSFSHRRTRRAALDKRWKRDLAQVAWPQRWFLPFKSLFWICCKVKTNWCWYCRREVLWLPVENQPLARQRTHSVVSALRWNKCHRYIQKLPCAIMNEKSPSGFLFFCISLSEGSWTAFLTPSEFHFRFVCRKGRWELPSLAGRSTSHVSLPESIWVSYPYCWVGHGKKRVSMYWKGFLGWLAQPLVQPSCDRGEHHTCGREPSFCTSSSIQHTGISDRSHCEIPAVAVTYKFCLRRVKREIHGQYFEAWREIGKGSRARTSVGSLSICTGWMRRE